MQITFTFLFFMYIIGCLWAFDYGHKALKNYGKITIKEFIVLIIISLLSWIMLFGLFLGGKLKQGSDGK